MGPLTDGLVALNGRVALGIDFDLGALPSAVKVCLDGHVCGCGVKRSCTGFVEKFRIKVQPVREGERHRWGAMAG